KTVSRKRSVLSLAVNTLFFTSAISTFMSDSCTTATGTRFLFTHMILMGIQARRHRLPRSPTREGSHRLWRFPASALTLVPAGTYMLRVTPGDSDHPERQAQGVTPSLGPLEQTSHATGIPAD
ncbi:hypothetical protein AVEN_138501-1, partial [Araneus ventricosus]